MSFLTDILLCTCQLFIKLLPSSNNSDKLFLLYEQYSFILLIKEANNMIARTWHGIVPESKSEEYHNYLLRTGVIDLEAVKGNLGVFILKRSENDNAHFQMISLWNSYESIKKFAGEDYNIARYYPEDKNYLIKLEKFVTHYDVLYSSSEQNSLE